MPVPEPRPREEALPNGLRLVVEEIPSARSVAVGLFVPAGAGLDPADRSGLAHLAEHMLFKGTARRSAREIARAADAIGAVVDGTTSREESGIFGRALPERLGDLAAILGDLSTASTFPADEFERERGVVEEEIRMYEDEPDERVHDLLLTAAWAGHPLGRPILGTLESVRAARRDDVVAFHKTRWTAGAAVVSIAGRTTFDEARRAAAEAFAGLPSGAPYAAPDAPGTIRPGRLHEARDLDQVHVCLGYDGVGRDDPRRFAAAVLNAGLGGSLSSRLFQAIREEAGLAYAVYSYLASFRQSGLLIVSAGSAPAHHPLLLEIAEREIDAVRREGLTDEEVERGKEQVRAQTLLSLESTEGRMHRNARTVLGDEERLSVDETVARIGRVDRRAVTDLAADLLGPACRVFAAIGPRPTAVAA